LKARFSRHPALHLLFSPDLTTPCVSGDTRSVAEFKAAAAPNRNRSPGGTTSMGS
jgi:hypothetical protein